MNIFPRMELRMHFGLKHKVRTARRWLVMALYNHQKWMAEIRNSQHEVLSANPNPKYPGAYERIEKRFWLYIPKWITELKQSGFQAKRVLDIGCAYGTLSVFAKRLFGCEIYCTDFTDVYLSPILRDRHGFHFAINNIENDEIPWPDKFDIIVFTEVIEHLNFHPVPTLQKIRGLLAPGGKLFVSTPDASEWGRITEYYARIEDIPWPVKSQEVVDAHIWQYTLNELEDSVHKGGFRIDKFRYSPGSPSRHFNLQLSVN